MEGDQDINKDLIQDEYTPISHSEFKHKICVQVTNRVDNVKETFLKSIHLEIE